MKKVLTGIEEAALLPYWLPTSDPPAAGGHPETGER